MSRQSSSDGEERSMNRGMVRMPITGLVILIVVVSGLIFDTIKADGDGFYADIMRMDRVATKIHQNYVEPIESQTLIDHAIEGMLDILDPHTTYFQKKEYDELRIHTEGKFGGLGIQISIRDNVLTVMTPIGGTPASRAGIRAGDQIVEIDGESTKGIKLDEAVNKLRGEPGSEVDIKIRRKGLQKNIDFTITREIIRIKAVPFSGVVGDSVGYVRLNSFSQEAGEEIKKAVKKMLKEGIRGCVLDLRHNPGGLLPQAIDVASSFLPKKSLVVSTRGRAPMQNKEFEVPSRSVLPNDIPLIVLVDRASASASEIVAGAIQDWDRGVVLGDTTFGKGSVQSILPLDNTHHLKLTTALYYTPSGRCINKPENDVKGDEADTSETGSAEVDTSGEESAASTEDTTVYRTSNGRIVYGGGGIIPDTIVEAEQYERIMRYLLVKDVFFKFANLEHPRLKKRGVTVDADYTVDQQTMADFHEFVDSLKDDYRSGAQVLLGEFKAAVGLVDTVDSASSEEDREDVALSEAEQEQLRELSGQMERIMEAGVARELREQRDEIKRHVRRYLLVREFGQDHEVVYRNKLRDDQQLGAAATLLRSPEAYAALLKPPGESE